MPTIDDIEKDLLERADGASVEDLGKIAAAMKAVAETKQTEANARNKARETRLELFKSLAAFLVPVVSLLALFGTIISQNKQLEASRQQLEDTEWRDLLTPTRSIPIRRSRRACARSLRRRSMASRPSRSPAA